MADSGSKHEPTGRWPRGRLLTLAAMAGVVAGSVAVYVSGLGDGNGGAVGAAECNSALAAAKRAAPFAKGEVAAFQPAEGRLHLADLKFLAPDNAETGLEAFAGKAVLLNLWATWCVPCREEMPALDKLQAELGGDDFSVVAVNIDLNNVDRARAFLVEIGVATLAFYSDPTTRLFTDLKRRGLAFGLPTTILIDGKGCKIGAVQGPAAWDSEDARALVQAAIAPT